MSRRYRGVSRIMVRGKPGLILLALLVLAGTLVAYMVFGRDRSAPRSRTSYYKHSRFGHRNDQFGAVKSSDKFGAKSGSSLGRQMADPPNFDNRVMKLNKFGGVYKQPNVDLPRKMVTQALDVQGAGDPDYNFEDDDKFVKNTNSAVKATSGPLKSVLKGNRSTSSQYGLYMTPDSKMSEQFANMEHIVHLDLKGAPPKMDYLIGLLPLMRKLGATGLLLEYEDMFPYNNDLSILAATNVYTSVEIRKLAAAAKLNKLKLIPLIPTFGHMEFVLKYPQFVELRENPDTPQVITPTLLKSYELINSMIDQMMLLHPNAPYIHIGCDEVYRLGKGKSADMMQNNNFTTHQIFLEHVKKVAGYVKSKYPNTNVIMWDDEIRKMEDADVQKSGLGGLVELMVWSYVPHPEDRLPEKIWPMYGRHFSGIWAASSFKGATGSAQFFTNASHHLENHLNWIHILQKTRDVVPPSKFRGFALTGWQRYDHFATLCELLPAAIPSLSVCLETVRTGGFTEDSRKEVSRILNCTKLVETGVPEMDAQRKYIISHDCRFPGSDFYYGIQELWTVVKDYKSDGVQSRLAGWLTDYHIKTRFYSSGQVQVLNGKLSKMLEKLRGLLTPMRHFLKQMYGDDTVEEWIQIHLIQRIDELKVNLNKIAVLLQGEKVWNKRPVPSLSLPNVGGIGSDYKSQQRVPQLQAGNQQLNQPIGNQQLQAGNQQLNQPIGNQQQKQQQTGNQQLNQPIGNQQQKQQQTGIQQLNQPIGNQQQKQQQEAYLQHQAGNQQQQTGNQQQQAGNQLQQAGFQTQNQKPRVPGYPSWQKQGPQFNQQQGEALTRGDGSRQGLKMNKDQERPQFTSQENQGQRGLPALGTRTTQLVNQNDDQNQGRKFGALTNKETNGSPQGEGRRQTETSKKDIFMKSSKELMTANAVVREGWRNFAKGLLKPTLNFPEIEKKDKAEKSDVNEHKKFPELNLPNPARNFKH